LGALVVGLVQVRFAGGQGLSLTDLAIGLIMIASQRIPILDFFDNPVACDANAQNVVSPEVPAGFKRRYDTPFDKP
jgi:hypothetical protein